MMIRLQTAVDPERKDSSMRTADPSALSRLPIGRVGALFALVLLGLTSGGCARERHEITPTTLGTDFNRTPRGKMTPFPWPGLDIVKAAPGSPAAAGPATVDTAAALASGERPPI
jgi:hypothetical protein